MRNGVTERVVHDTPTTLKKFETQGYQLANTPPCMTEQDWQQYQLHAIRLKSNTNRNHAPVSPCLDCTSDYADAMSLQGKCRSSAVLSEGD